MNKKYLLKHVSVIMMIIASIICSINCQSKPTSAKQSEKRTEKQAEKRKLFSVEMTMVNGSVTKADAFTRVIASHAWYSTIRTDIPSVTYTKRNSLPVNVGPYEVIIPFEIIQKASFEKRTPANSNTYNHVKVLMGNGLEIEGSTYGFFKGKTDLGEADFDIENINKIVFNQNALKDYNATAFGTHEAIIHQIDGKTIELKGAGFLSEKVNENGCYLDDECVEKLGFKVKDGGGYEIPWNKISAVVHDKPQVLLGMSYTTDSPYKLITKEGKELFGSCQSFLEAAEDVRGITNINGVYNLLATVPLFRDTYAKLEFK